MIWVISIVSTVICILWIIGCNCLLSKDRYSIPKLAILILVIVSFIPIVNMCIAIVYIVISLVALFIFEEYEWNEDSKFVRKWILNKKD